MNSPAFIGRAEELSELTRLLARAIQGEGAAAVIGGDAGVGKTRLCRELKAAAAAHQMRVIEGRCSPAEAAIPYGPFVDALRFRLGKGEGAEAAAVLQPILAHVAPLFSGLAVPPQLERRSADATDVPFERIFGVLHRLAGLGPVLFIIEDLHWADPTSRDLIQFITRHIASLSMMFVTTYRTDEIHAGHPVHRVVAAIAREPHAVRMQLEPLPLPQVTQMLALLLGAEPDADFARAVWRRTEGNPLFLEELITVLTQAFPGRTDFGAADLSQVSTPTTLSEMVHERLATLSPDACEALLVGSVIGRRFRFDVLAAALEWSEDRLLPAVEQLVVQGLLVEVSEEQEETYAFRHSLVQEAMYGSTIGRRRRIWHRRVAAALEGGAGGTELLHTTLARHYNLGGEPDKARVHFMLGGDEAARLCAWKDAEAMYEEALSIAERQGNDAGDEADIIERLAEVAWWQNQLPAVEQYASEALMIRRALGQRAAAALLLRRLANLDAHQRGDFGSAVKRLEEALALLDDNSSEAPVILNDLGRLQLARNEWPEACALFEKSLGLSMVRDDFGEEAFALAMLGWVAVRQGNVNVGVQRLELARALVMDEEMAIDRGAEVYHSGIRALDAAREHRLAAEWLQEAIRYARTHEAHGDLAIHTAYTASVRRRAGEWRAALKQADEAIEQLRLMGRAELKEALRIRGDLLRGRGDLEGARAAYDEAVSLGECDAAIGKALLAAAEHRWDHAAELVRAELAKSNPLDRLFAMRVLPILIEALTASGRTDAAQSTLQQLTQLTNSSDYAAGVPALAQSRGIVEESRGDVDAAAKALRAAAADWTALQLPYEAARAKLLLARVLATGDAKSEAADWAREASRSFSELEAKLELAQAESVLRSTGLRTRLRRAAPELPAPLSALTGREAEVLAELTRGRTNKQIAKTLSMSPKTVGNHVGAILTKLGCATRTEAAQFYARLMTR